MLGRDKPDLALPAGQHTGLRHCWMKQELKPRHTHRLVYTQVSITAVSKVQLKYCISSLNNRDDPTKRACNLPLLDARLGWLQYKHPCQ